MRLYSVILHKIKNYFLAGFGTILPLFITVYLIVALFRFIDNLVGKQINVYLEQHYGFTVPGLGFVGLIVVILIVGFISSHFVGRKLFPFFERLFIKIPLVGHIYPSAKQLSDSLFKKTKKQRLKEVVLVKYPHQDSYTIGFITNEELMAINAQAQKDLVCVFIPFSPTPFSGIILFLQRTEIIHLDVSIDQAVKCIVSGGVISPESRKKERDRDN